MPKDTFFRLNEEKQEKVIRMAINEFVKHGFQNGNIGDIAKNAGVAKGSMYQYFENKKELYTYSVKWAVSTVIRKNEQSIMPKEMDLFDYFDQSSRQLISQIAEEKELTVFIQEVMLGKQSSATDESIAIMVKTGEDFVLRLVRQGIKNGSVRSDIDENTLALFLMGASMKVKENILNRAKNAGQDIMKDGMGVYENEIKAMIDLLKNGMGAKPCLSK